MSTEPEHYYAATVTLVDKVTGVTTRYDIPNVRTHTVKPEAGPEPELYTSATTRVLQFRFEVKADQNGVVMQSHTELPDLPGALS